MLYLNDKPVQVTMFPDNTSQVWKLPADITVNDDNKYDTVKWEFSHEGEFLQLAQLADLIEKVYRHDWKLILPYLPYGRQDKNFSNEATFALRTFAYLLNSLGTFCVEILDPHSEVAIELIDNSVAVYPTDIVHKLVYSEDIDVLCYPDSGAVKKYSKMYSECIPVLDGFIYGEKVRDQATGHITSYKLVGDPKDKNVLIVDDICDGGMTFKLLAKDLLEAGAKSVRLFVTHGIFSKGVRTLRESGILRVFTHKGEAFGSQGNIAYKEII